MTGAATISLEHIHSFLSIARQLGNTELIDKLIGLHEFPDELTSKNDVLQSVAQHFIEIKGILSGQ
jgi:hypothetical protein